MRNRSLYNMLLSALFLAMGMVFPILTMQIKEIGDSLLPMHLPVMLCGLICGWKYGFAVGFLLPFLRSVIFSMPPLYPNAVWMAFELAAYGFTIGFMYARLNKRSIGAVYASLAVSMVAGRVMWGITKALLLGVAGKAFPMQAFIAGGFVDALPGMILQLILVPSIFIIYQKIVGRNRTTAK